jgi:hypothetical protein
MTFRAQVELALGVDPQSSPSTWPWTDITEWVRGGIQIDRGRADGFGTTPPSKMRCRVDNNGGRFVARNALGPWYGTVRRNLPIRVLADADDWPVVLTDTFTRTVSPGWGTSDNGLAWSIVAGAGGSVLTTDASVNGTAAVHSVPVAGAYRYNPITTPRTLTDVDMLVTGITCPLPTGGNLEPANIQLRRVSSVEELLCRVQITTAGAFQIVLISSGFTIAGPTTVPSLTHAAATPFNVRAQAYGSTVRMRLWQAGPEPTTWTVTAEDSAPMEGTPVVGVRSGIATGNTNTKPVLFNYSAATASFAPVRFAGFIDELPVSWNGSTRDSTAEISASGFFRRLNQGDAPVRSAMYRTRTTADHHQPIDYWPMEDQSGSTQFVNAIADGRAMTLTNQAPAISSIYVGSEPLPAFANLGTRASVRPFTATQYAVRFLLAAPAVPAASCAVVQWRAGGWTWQVVVGSGAGNMVLQAWDTTSVERLSSGAINFGIFYLNLPCQILVDVSQNGADIDWSLTIVYYTQAFAGGTNTVSGTVTGATIAMPTEIKTQTVGGPMTNWVIGHMAIYDEITASPASEATTGWIGNTATEHISGICRDARIPHSLPADPPVASITTLGPQSNTSIPGLLQEGASADGGILFEDGFAVGYVARYRLYNQAVALTLNIAGLKVSDLHPADDDQAVRNDITITRSGGSSGQATDAAHIELYGRYDTSETLNLLDDSQTVPQAYHRLSLGTVDDLRYPGVEINLGRDADLRDAWQVADAGSRIQVTNPPDELPPDVIDLMLQGWSERIDSGGNTWTATLNCTSYLPWIGFVLDSSRLSSGASTLSSSVTTTATSWSVATVGPLWPTGATSISLWCDGEQVTVTNITGASSPQTFTVTRSVNTVVKVQNSGSTVDIYRPGRLAL